MGRFHFEQHRQRYAAAHGQLRLILSAYLACSPTQLRFMTGHYGKPALQDGGDVCFNLSHAGDQMLVGVVRGRAIGVDIEQIRPDFATTEIATHYFSSAEQDAFQAVPDAQKPLAFFNAWTRKEAFIKAIGEGLSFPLGDFDVTLVPGEPARLLAVRGSTEEAARWQMWGWDAGDGYAAAVVVNGHPL
jgi:4'-phosphopantetheinyl transferase